MFYLTRAKLRITVTGGSNIEENRETLEHVDLHITTSLQRNMVKATYINCFITLTVS